MPPDHGDAQAQARHRELQRRADESAREDAAAGRKATREAARDAKRTQSKGPSLRPPGAGGGGGGPALRPGSSSTPSASGSRARAAGGTGRGRWSGGVQVLRMETRAALDRNLHQHVLGNIRPDTARPVEERSVILHDDYDGARSAIRDALQLRKDRRTRGPKPSHCVDFVLAGPPGYEEPGAWDEETCRAWAGESLDWVRDVCGPRSVIAGAALHRDESAPHVHVLVVPIASDGTLAWKHVCSEAHARFRGERPGPKRKMGDWYTSLQDDLHERLSKRYGLTRGERGSKATHKAISRQKAAERATAIAKKQAKRALDTAGEAVRHARAGDEAIGKALAGEETPEAQAGRQERERLEAQAKQAHDKAQEQAQATVKQVTQATAGTLTTLQQALDQAKADAAQARQDLQAKVASAEALAKATQAQREQDQQALQASQDETTRVVGVLEATRTRAETAEARVRDTVDAAKALHQQSQQRIADLERQLAARQVEQAPSVTP